MNLKIDNQYLKNFSHKLSYKDLVIFLIPFVIFMVYLYIFNPGILRPDTFNQFHQIATSTYGNWHPFFHTFIDMVCLSIYPNPKSIAILQIVTFSVIWTSICNYFRYDDETDENKKLNKIFIIQVIFTTVISLIPINAIYSITILKDILFSYFLLLSCFLIKIVLDKKENSSYLLITILSISMAFVSQIRPNGLYLILVLLVCLFIYLYKTTKSKKLYLLIPVLTIIFILLISSLNIIYDVENDQNDAIYTKVTHMLADYDLNLDLSSQDRDKIHELVSEKKIKKYYNKIISDPIRDAGSRDVYNNDKMTYISLAIKYSIKNPTYFIGYVFGSSPMVWKVVRDWNKLPYKTNTEKSKLDYYSTKNITPIASYENVVMKNKGTEPYEQLNSFVNKIGENKITDTLFDSPALYMYLSFILIGGIYLLTKSKDIFIVYLPNMLNILIIFASTPIQDVRYLYPNLLLFYFLIIMLLGILQKRKEIRIS